MDQLQKEIMHIVREAQGDKKRVFVDLLRDDRVQLLKASKIEIADATLELINIGMLEGSVSADKTLTEVWSTES